MKEANGGVGSPWHTLGLLALCVGGIYGSYLTQGVVQESLATRRFGPQQLRFTHLKALNGAQSWGCFAVAGALLFLVARRDAKADFPRVWDYWRPAITNSIGPALGIEALKNISYPAQVLAKSCKMIPVMVMGTLVGGKFYSAREYACACLIAAGISLFAQQNSSKVVGKLAAPNAPLGYTLCLLNLISDGYTNAAQDELHRRHRDTSALWTMCWMNAWCGAYNAAYLFGASSAGRELLRFCWDHPQAGREVLLFCLCGAVGQIFIFVTIRNFGSLTNTLITTTRKFFNILLSVLFNGNPLLAQQWLAVGLVFSGLLLSTASKAGKKKLKQDEKTVIPLEDEQSKNGKHA